MIARATQMGWDVAAASKIISGFVGVAGGLLPALHELQASFGFVPRPAIALLAKSFNVSEAEIYGVASFYHDFRLEAPLGRHVLKLCRAEGLPGGWLRCAGRLCEGPPAGGLGRHQRGRALDAGAGVLSWALRLRPLGTGRRQAASPARSEHGANADGCGALMTKPLRMRLSKDAVALALGADGVAAALRSAAEKRNLEFALTRTGSRGMVWLEPLLEIETESGWQAYGPLSAPEADGVLAAALENRPHPKVIGPIESHAFFKRQTRLIFARSGIIDPESAADYVNAGGLVGLKQAIELGSKSILEEVGKSGLRGRGGAGFPAGIKWRGAAEAKGEQKYVVCNADEGDSGTFADRMLMEGDPFLLIEGMAIAGIAAGATKGYLYIRLRISRCHRGHGARHRGRARGGNSG